jgi:hypothetical protein
MLEEKDWALGAELAQSKPEQVALKARGKTILALSGDAIA